MDEKTPDKQEIITHKQELLPQATPASLMALALQSGVGIEHMDKMFDLQIRYEENEAKKQEREAKKAFTNAMAAFKADAPDISKDKTVGYKNKNTGELIGYTHASLGNVTKTISSALGNHGISSAWKTEQDGERVTVICIITHRDGYSESTQLTASADKSGKKNAIQALGSTISYLERYTLLALTGCSTCDQDDDGQQSSGGNESATEPITAARFETWLDGLVKAGDTVEEIEKRYAEKSEELDKLTELERKKVDGYKKDLIDLMLEGEKPPETISCPGGLKVTATDCEECPQKADCEEFKNYKENK